MGELVARGWVAARASESGETGYQLTDEGRRQHGVILTTQKQVRRLAMQGIGEDEYAAAIRVLQRMADNLGGGSEAAER